MSAGQKVGVVNLGCARNLVDAQMMLGRLKKQGQRIVEVSQAQTVVVNTCSFIEEARRESIDTILDMVELKKKGKIQKVIVAGCLAQRYGSQLALEFPEVDAFMGTPTLNRDNMPQQLQLTPGHFAYVKICESCFNACSFCAIPKIKGKFISRTIESIVQEVRRLDAQGVREINIIGQDITAYGMDIYRRKSLARLLKELAGVCGNIEWIRLLYAFPSHVTDELIETIAGEPKVCPYIDMPLQHISDHILLEQNRNITTRQTIELVQKIRRRIPEVFLRTTFIAGLPGETDGDFEELRRFVNDFRFERAGVFVYSKEEGTKAAQMKEQVPEGVKKRRLDALMKDQQVISSQIQQSFVGRSLKVLIEEKEKGQAATYIGRSQYDAPDVDGVVYVRSEKALKAGDFVQVKITDAYEYDLAGVME
ncbi:MAG: 30S ribosomal protein S12 methylthiotransferase RimO [Candidatus Omnitrophica bacterium]|nr:30S ribosomal protein S12 methylthiotransferase RimO [Candidatus Omnitrophota bacterium]MDE2215132.1 30S ribosomal protein S12 methylthiotransferase RimO [Candidatus Omnitrophota bacterium]MDE2231486.1 30S ribosomal protein S12 methylthiotransferase RimO [Candidatus Omnitrophota bacterium]